MELRTLTATGRDGKEETLDRGSVDAFLPGRAHEVELWYVDQEASLWVDGRPIVRANFALDFQYLVDRAPLPNRSTPEIRIGVSGAPVVLERVEVDRDIYYNPPISIRAVPQDGGNRAWGCWPRRWIMGASGMLVSRPRLQADQFSLHGRQQPAEQ